MSRPSSIEMLLSFAAMRNVAAFPTASCYPAPDSNRENETVPIPMTCDIDARRRSSG